MFGKTGWTFRGFPKAPKRSERKKWDARYLRDTQEERFDNPRKLRAVRKEGNGIPTTFATLRKNVSTSPESFATIWKKRKNAVYSHKPFKN